MLIEWAVSPSKRWCSFMGMVPEFEYDVFVSFAHIDNEPYGFKANAVGR